LLLINFKADLVPTTQKVSLELKDDVITKSSPTHRYEGRFSVFAGIKASTENKSGR
jgi:hypothetical protein